jgi:Ca2+-binding RTX toxin-like protein
MAGINVTGRIVNGTKLADYLTAGDWDDTINSYSGNDFLDGGAGNDKLYGGAGNDTIKGGAGADLNDGGTGIDTVDYSASAAGVQIDLYEGLAAFGDAEGDTFVSIEKFIGSDHRDIIWTDDANNTIVGGKGNDNLHGGGGDDRVEGGVDQDYLAGESGNDTLLGGEGNDTVQGGSGADRLDGSTGNDTLDYGGGSVGVRVNLQAQIVSGGEAQGDVVSGFENVTGSRGSDLLVGSTGNNVIMGGDSIDIIDGGAGKDTIAGGNGDDRLIGGADADIFQFITTEQFVAVGLPQPEARGDDTIYDFQAGVDRIEVIGFEDSIDDLIFTQNGDDLRIEFDHGSVTLVSVSMDELLGTANYTFLF